MRRYGVQASSSVSGSANTATNMIGIQTAASRAAQIYEVIYGMSAAVADAQIRTDIFGVSAFTAGTAATPVNVEVGGTAAVTGVSTGPTATASGLSLLAIEWNSRATVRWAAVDPDSRILIPAGGGTGGAVTFQNQQPGTVAGLTVLTHIYFAE